MVADFEEALRQEEENREASRRLMGIAFTGFGVRDLITMYGPLSAYYLERGDLTRGEERLSRLLLLDPPSTLAAEVGASLLLLRERAGLTRCEQLLAAVTQRLGHPPVVLDGITRLSEDPTEE